ncbi:TetR/AcrR family transcriptional regulator [Sphingomonas sp. BIUV-7]|uniref:TetR/AcrR family transcriptional regulator n=1 Tax=Sphingomonas natans TaxID=3063330 RepID=A0ABT8YD76_9SPHN|nr:TetR/AcrR family transcriptional regulator [Sphingomonas sp. BIUV-7]MDO6415575.1 TetR/AcrR family transcriptional regulator [Sphingomonas sp. BIUV-7]
MARATALSKAAGKLARPAPVARPATAASRRVNDPDRTRADILEVAASHFATHGFSGSRVDEIAAQTNTSKRMIYYYFGSKEGLYREVLGLRYNEIRVLEKQSGFEQDDPQVALATLIGTTFDYHQSHSDFVRLVMVENIHRGENIGEVPGIESRAQSVLDVLRRLLDRGIATGVFRKDIDPFQLHMSISALCFYNVSNRHTLSRIFATDIAAPDMIAIRRRNVIEMVMRWVVAAP